MSDQEINQYLELVEKTIEVLESHSRLLDIRIKTLEEVM